MKISIQTGVASLLLFNIAVAVFVIQTVANSKPSYQQLNILDLDEAYLKYTREKDHKRHKDGNTDDTSAPSLEFLSLLKPVGHFSGLDLANCKADTETRTIPIRNWANPEGSERTLLYNDMTYQNGSVTVPVAGIYHINSHVKFYVEDNRKGDNSSQTFHHQIVRYSAFTRKQIVLFEKVETECREGINDGAHLEYPSLIGGLAQLDAGDQVIVRVSHFALLRHDRDWHYFDMYLV